MRPGPSKSFDPDEALELARDVFWRRGYDGTAISELEDFDRAQACDTRFTNPLTTAPVISGLR